MAQSKRKVFLVDTQPAKDVVVDGLTRDVSAEACVFDLIDNSIDAARDTIFRDALPSERETLPSDYSGFWVKLTLNGHGIKIDDNCGGIPILQLQKNALRFGQRSTHKMGIGAFGVGLNRAIFKLGQSTSLKTDTGKERAEFSLRPSEYLQSPSWNLEAEQVASTGKAGTEIDIRESPEAISHLFGDRDWVDNLRDEIGRRYGRFIGKNLSIKVNGIAATNLEVPLRDGGPYEGEYKFYKTDNGVTIHIEYGQHRDHRFTKEPDYDQKRNALITDQYGWTVLCNDRAILMSDRSDRTGWDTKFHTEFYGFVGYVSFVCSDPAMLPWNTFKMDVDLNNHAYRRALIDMRIFAEKWRSISEQRKRGAVPLPVPPKQPDPSTTGRGKPLKQAPKKKITIKPVLKVDHHQFRTVLPRDVNELHCFDKHLKLVHEAKGLDLGEFTYSGLALIRMLFESSVVTYFDRHEKFVQLKQSAIDRRRKSGLKITAEDERKLTPNLDEMLSFLENNPDVWGAAKQTFLKHSVKKMGAHKQTLNSVLHNPFQAVSNSKAFEIRDEVLPLLRHLIET